MVRRLLILSAAVLLAACDFGDGDNAPLETYSAEEMQGRADRRAASPKAAIYGKKYQIIEAVIDGRGVPIGNARVHITLEDHAVQGWDGCYKFKGGGIFSPSGYEYSFLDSGAFDAQEYECVKGEERWMGLYEFEGRVWKLSLDQDILTMTEYYGKPYTFRLRPLSDL